MMRRVFVLGGSAAVAWASSPPPLLLPVRLIVDRAPNFSAPRLEAFRESLWSEAVRSLAGCGIRLDVTWASGEVGRPAFREPIIAALERRALNFVVTDRIPVEWDHSGTMCGLTTLYRGFHLCMVALDHAHGNQLPFLSVNTCLHELLHALLLDIFAARPSEWQRQTHEARVDWYATRLWLLGGAGDLRDSAAIYLRKLLAVTV